MSLGSVPGGRPVVFDTNALFLPFTDGTDLDSELERLFGAVEWVLPSSVLGELKNISNGPSASARHAKAALQLARRVRTEETKLPGDDGLLEVARRLKAAVVTGDRKVQEEANKSGLAVVVPREKGRLALRRSGSG
jgi:rRNA-processing protein FCF1